MTALTLLSFFFFTALVGFLTWRITRGKNQASAEGYFLAGRTLTARAAEVAAAATQTKMPLVL